MTAMSRWMGAVAGSMVLAGASCLSAQDWPQWRGPNRTGVSRETGLLKEWPAEGPKLAWKATGLGKGYAGVSYADGMLYCREEDNGTMLLLAASPAGYAEKGRFRQPDRAPEKAWPHPTIANGKLCLRDQDVLLCYEVK